MIRLRTQVLVLGAGLQGAGVALELARRGIEATLVERDALAMNRASLRNEGKIHLGLIYAQDASRATAFLQLKGALRFRRILARWIDVERGIIPSTPFHYLVARDSLVGPEPLSRHYEAVERRVAEQWNDDPELDYLGVRPPRLTRPLDRDEIARHFDPDRFIAGFETAELAIDCDRLALCVRSTIASAPGLTFR